MAETMGIAISEINPLNFILVVLFIAWVYTSMKRKK